MTILILSPVNLKTMEHPVDYMMLIKCIMIMLISLNIG